MNHVGMTGWKNAFDFEQDAGPTTGRVRRTKPAYHAMETTSRIKRTSEIKAKGKFQKKASISDAPNLLSVINAKPEIKKKATAEAKDRKEKNEEKKRKMAARVTIKKNSPMQLSKQTWTNPIKPKSVPFASKPKPSIKGKKSSGLSGDSGSKPAATEGDWNKAYQDILSPQSGKPKLVAKQDLISHNSMPSPKKKVRPPPKAAIPAIMPPLATVPKKEEEDAPEPAAADEKRPSIKDRIALFQVPSEEEPLEPKDAAEPVPVETTAVLVTPEKPVNENEEETAPVVAKKDTTGEKVEDQPETGQAPPKGESNIAPDEYLDYSSQGSVMEEESAKDVESSMDIESAMEVESTQRSEDPVVRPPRVREKKQLVLEFALPGEYGEEDDGGPGLEVPVDIESFDDLSSVGSWPSIESDDSYDTKMNKMMQRWVDVNGAYDDDFDNRTQYDNDVDLEDNVLDHIVLAAPDLDEAMAQFEEMTGIKPNPVGPLQGLGAKTAHVGLDHNRYIEILAPDEENPGPLGDELKALKPGTLTPYHYSIRSSEVSRLIEGYVYDVLGWDPDHIAMVQALPDNSLRQWDLLTMYGHDVGGCAPCYVKWKDHAHHPTASIALKATLTACTVRAPEDHDVHKLITGVGGLNVEYGEPMLEVTFSSPKGPLTFSTNYPRGLVFPGYDDDHHISDMPELLSASGDGSGDEDGADVGDISESSQDRTNDK